MTNHRDDMHDDAPLDGAMLEAARAYNTPPATPRDAMWERIAAARAASPRPVDAESTDEVPAIRVIPLAPRTARDGRASRRPAWALPLAAALLLGVGIGVGRLSVTREALVTRPPVAVAPGADSTTRPVTPPSGPPTRELATSGPEGRSGGEAESREPRAESASSDTPIAYRLATAEHLLSTETLLATISADAKAGRADTSVAAWARDLLGTTRVLLDSPAGRDPRMARLLEDLELVLAQVAQLPAERGAEELKSIERAVQRRDVMTRVRAAIPTGPLSAGT